MKDEYDFSKGVRGQFFRSDARLNIPVYYPEDEDIFADVRDRSAGREEISGVAAE